MSDMDRDMHALETRVYEYMQKQHLIDVNKGVVNRVLLCVSGGIDSMALLHILSAIRSHSVPTLDLEVINFNHKIRSESYAERDFVEKWAKHYDINFHAIERSDEEPAFDKNLQEEARKWRQEVTKGLLNKGRQQQTLSIYDILGPDDDSNDSHQSKSKIMAAMAHHSDDQFETILMKLVRGAHISKLHPMLPLSSCGNYMRPLLGVSKLEITQYMQDKGFDWCEDASNQDTKYKRNAVRLELIPLLEKLAAPTGDSSEPIRKRFQYLGEQSLALRKWLEAETKKFIRNEVRIDTRHNDFVFHVDASSAFMDSPKVVQDEIMHFLVLEASGSSLDYEQTQRVVSLVTSPLKDGTKMRSISLADGWMAQRIGLAFRLTRPTAEEEWQQVQSQSAVFRHPAFCSLNIQEYSNRRLDPVADDAIVFHISQQTLEESSGSVKMCLRRPHEGDCIQFCASAGDKDVKLTQFLKNEGVALHMRDRVLVLVRECEGEEEVLGVMLPGVDGSYSPHVAVNHQCNESNSDGICVYLQIL